MLLTLKCLFMSLYRLSPPAAPPSSKGWDFKFAHWKQPVKVFSSLEQQSHCTTHQEGLNVNISLFSAQTVANFSNFLAVFQYSRIIYTTFDFFFSQYFIILKFDGFPPQMFFSSSIKNSQRNLGTHPMKTLWIYRITEFIWEVWEWA